MLKLHEIKFREPRNTKHFWGKTPASPQKPLVVVVSGSTKKSLKNMVFTSVTFVAETLSLRFFPRWEHTETLVKQYVSVTLIPCLSRPLRDTNINS